MQSDMIEVRAISRVSAALVALIGATLLTTVRLPAMPAPGLSDTASVRVIRKKDASDAQRADTDTGLAAALRASAAQDGVGLGDEVLLWVNDPSGAIVFRNAGRFRRCVEARLHGMEESDCPSASDLRQMVLEDDAGRHRDARASRGV